MNKKETLEVLIKLYADLPASKGEISDEKLQVWFEALSFVPKDLALQAVRKYLVSVKIYGEPNLHDFCEVVRGLTNPLTPEETWVKLLALVRRIRHKNYYWEFVKSHLKPQTARVIQALGGWGYLCGHSDPESLRKEFLRLYSDFSDGQSFQEVFRHYQITGGSDGLRITA